MTYYCGINPTLTEANGWKLLSWHDDGELRSGGSFYYQESTGLIQFWDEDEPAAKVEGGGSDPFVRWLDEMDAESADRVGALILGAILEAAG